MGGYPFEVLFLDTCAIQRKHVSKSSLNMVGLLVCHCHIDYNTVTQVI